MFLKLATLNRRIGGLEQKMRDFEISRRKKLKSAEKLHGPITEENAGRSQALVNYVKYFYENMDECEEILTENLKMICFSLDLDQSLIKDQIDRIPQTELLKQDIACTKEPAHVDREKAKRMQKERRRNKEIYERHVRRQLEIIQERSENDPNKTYDVRNPDKPAQL